MERSLLIGLLLIGSITLIGCNKILEEQPEQSVIINSVNDYNNAMVGYVGECINVQDNIRYLYEEKNAPSEDIIKSVEEGIKICNKAQDKINTLGDWEGNPLLKDAAFKYLQKYIEYFTLFKEWVPNTEILHVYYDDKQYNELTELNEELLELGDEIGEIQNDFAKKYGYQLEGDPIDETIVLGYNDLMISYVENCINTVDTIYDDIIINFTESGEMIQAVNNSIGICEEQKESAESLGDWEGDNSLKDAVIKFLELNIEYLNKLLAISNYLFEPPLTDEQVEEYNLLLDTLNILEEEVDSAGENIQNVQNSFAKKFDLVLE